jgi:hypothetical protein
MTQEEKRIKLALASKGVLECYEGVWYYWDYFNDLNAVHEFEKTLTDEEAYETELIRVCQATPIWHATSSQRAEALGLTLKLWN